MTTTDALRRAPRGHGADRDPHARPRVRRDLPDTAHGGSGARRFRRARRARGPRESAGPLSSSACRSACRCACASSRAGRRRLELFDVSPSAGGSVLVDGRVARAARPAPPRRRPADDAARGRRDAAARLAPHASPVASTTARPARAPARRRRRRWAATWTPRRRLRRADGTLAPVALTTLLDEAAFWLGALATGESGMTTELRVRLHDGAPRRGPITVAGAAHSACGPRAGDPRYWDTEVAARDAGRVAWWPAPPSRSSPCAAPPAGWSTACSRSTRRTCCGACSPATSDNVRDVSFRVGPASGGVRLAPPAQCRERPLGASSRGSPLGPACRRVRLRGAPQIVCEGDKERLMMPRRTPLSKPVSHAWCVKPVAGAVWPGRPLAEAIASSARPDRVAGGGGRAVRTP